MAILDYMLGHQVFHFYKTSQTGHNRQRFSIPQINHYIFFWDLDTPNFYNKNEINAIGDELSSLILSTHTETEVDDLFTGIDLYGSKTWITNNGSSLTYPLNELIMHHF